MAGKKRSAGRGIFGGTRGWIAAGTLAAYSVMGGTKSVLAEKEKTDPAGSGAAARPAPGRPMAAGHGGGWRQRSWPAGS